MSHISNVVSGDKFRKSDILPVFGMRSLYKSIMCQILTLSCRPSRPSLYFFILLFFFFCGHHMQCLFTSSFCVGLIFSLLFLSFLLWRWKSWKIMPIQSRNCEWESGDVNCMYIICFGVIRSTGNLLYFAVKREKKSIHIWYSCTFVENKDLYRTCVSRCHVCPCRASCWCFLARRCCFLSSRCCTQQLTH